MTVAASRTLLSGAVLCCLLAGLGALAAEAETGLGLAGKMALGEVRLSPDGEYVAAFARTPGQPRARNLLTMRLADNSTRVVTGYADIDVSWFAWVSDTRLLFGTESHATDPGQPGQYRGAFTIDRDGGGGAMVERARESGMRFLARVPGDRNGVLITRPSQQPGHLDVLRLDLKRATTRNIVTTDHAVDAWVADHAGRVRAATGRAAGTDDDRQCLRYRPVDSDRWDEVLCFEDGEFQPLGFTADNRRLIAVSRIGRQRFVLLQFDPANLHSGKVLLEDPVYDVFGPGHGELVQSRTGHLVAYRYLSDRPRVVYFDRRWEGRQADIDEVLPDSVNVIAGFSDDERKLLVLSYGDDGHGDYYIFDDIVRRLKFLVARTE